MYRRPLQNWPSCMYTKVFVLHGGDGYTLESNQGHLDHCQKKGHDNIMPLGASFVNS